MDGGSLIPARARMGIPRLETKSTVTGERIAQNLTPRWQEIIRIMEQVQNLKEKNVDRQRLLFQFGWHLQAMDQAMRDMGLDGAQRAILVTLLHSMGERFHRDNERGLRTRGYSARGEQTTAHAAGAGNARMTNLYEHELTWVQELLEVDQRLKNTHIDSGSVPGGVGVPTRNATRGV